MASDSPQMKQTIESAMSFQENPFVYRTVGFSYSWAVNRSAESILTESSVKNLSIFSHFSVNWSFHYIGPSVNFDPWKFTMVNLPPLTYSFSHTNTQEAKRISIRQLWSWKFMILKGKGCICFSSLDQYKISAIKIV